MTEEGGPSKTEIQETFRKLKHISANRVCFDCSTKNPTWASVTYGVFICIDCSAVHRSLGVHLSFVRSTQLDTNWTWTQLRNMQLGGNANAAGFFSQHNCTSTDAQQKYNSRAAHLYRQKLDQLVAKHNKIHGNKIVFESEELSKSPVQKDTDFFEELHSQASQQLETLTLDNSTRLTKNFRNGSDNTGEQEGPNVSAAFSTASGDTAASSAPRKVTIGQKKPASKLGVKKGLGAQKVKSDFSEIEREAQMVDQMKERREETEKAEAEQRAADEEKQMASMRLAYQDLSKQQKRREEQLKNLDPKKAEQVERLGMGIGVRAGVSHSAMSDMKTIEQDTPASSVRQPSKSNPRVFDAFDILEQSLRESSRSELGMDKDRSSGWVEIDKVPKYPKQAVADDDFFVTALGSSKPSRAPRVETASSTPTSDEAQKKFKGAKAISSDQFFGSSQDSDFERRTNLSRFDGKSSISSADYFGDGHQRNQQQGYQSPLQNVDLDDVKESLREGAHRVANRLSNLANGVMSSLQEKYGY